MRTLSLLTPLAAAALLAFPLAAHAQSTAPVAEQKPGLLKEAEVRPADAQKLALARVPRGVVEQADIEQEHNVLTYRYDISVPDRPGTTMVKLDAKTGKVLSITHPKAPQMASQSSMPEPTVASTPSKPVMSTPVATH